MYTLTNLNIPAFLQQHWQKKPLLIRGGIAVLGGEGAFEDPLDEHDLAGLAQQEGIDARIVSRQGQQWSLMQGPFDEFEPHCVGAWSLLVQGVDKHLDEGALLMNAFNFIPRWRMDDLMVSYSVPGAGVGAHVDQYDVFIIQGKGARRWQVGERQAVTEHRPHALLKQVEGFEAVIDEVLNPGDVLYIPPGCPHQGEALEPSMNYSVGFRAPSQQDMLSGFADYALQHDSFERRYTDPEFAHPQAFASELSLDHQQRLRELLLASIKGEAFIQWLGGYLSDAPEPETQADALPVTGEDMEAHLAGGGELLRELAVKALWMEPAPGQDEITLFIGEHRFKVPLACRDQLDDILTAPVWTPTLSQQPLPQSVLELLAILVSKGLFSLG